MSYIEAAFIKRQEYDASKPDRLQEHQLCIDEFYVAMFALAANNARLQAAKVPVKFEDIAQTDSGIYLASLVCMDKDLKPTLKRVAELTDGHWSDIQQAGINVGQVKPIECYFRKYGDSIDDELHAISAHVVLPDQERVLT